MTRTILTIDGLHLKVANQLLFQDLSLTLPPSGITALMGPVGIGKSSLLAWLSGEFNPMLFEANWGHIEYFYAPLSAQNRPALFRQKEAKSFDETMRIIDRLLVGNPALFCIDEVTARLNDDEAEAVLQRLSIVAQSRSVLMVSHNQRQVADYADSVLLLAGGIAQEHTPTKSFFSLPSTSAGRQFLRTGGADVVHPGTATTHLRTDMRDVPVEMRMNLTMDTWEHSLRWITGDKLGVFRPENGHAASDDELLTLREQGISTVVVVSENKPESFDRLKGKVPDCIWHPMPVDEVIPVSRAKLFCHELQEHLDRNQRLIVITCSNSQAAERTAASQLVHMGLGADKAAEVAQSLVGDTLFSIENEQLLWDLELANDLDDDSTQVETATGSEHGNQPYTATGNVMETGRKISDETSR